MRSLKFLLLSCFLFSLFSIANAQKQFKALMITTTKGWHHESIHHGVLALQQLAARNNFDITLLESPNGFTDKFLEQFKVIIFLNTTGDILNDEQQKAMERFIQSGKGFVGIHSASDTEYDWEWYTKLVGRMFVTHPPTQTARLKVLDNSFPGLQGLGGGKLWTDEYYQFTPEKTTGLTYILGVDESTYKPKDGGMGALHPIAWYHQFDGGRSFYTMLGHLPAVFSDPDFLTHLYAGIYWAATGMK